MTSPHNLGLFGACLALGLGHAPPSISAQEHRNGAPVVMSDRDTIIGPNGDHLRLLGLDAPLIDVTACITDLRASTATRVRLQQYVSTGQARLTIIGKRSPDGRIQVRLFIAGDDAAALVMAARLIATEVAQPDDTGWRHPPCSISAQ